MSEDKDIKSETSWWNNPKKDLYHKKGEAFAAARKNKTDSQTDALTGAYSRHWLNSFIDTNPSRKQPLGVVILDMDDFKFINDTYGHDKGDEALQMTARLLIRGLRPDDKVVRYGGDEFVLLMPGIDDVEKAEAILKRIKEDNRNKDIERRNTSEKNSFSSDISFTHGISICYPSDNIRQAITKADEELYRKKGLNKEGSESNKNV